MAGILFEIVLKRLLPEAVEASGVAYVPGSAFFHDGGGGNTMRLSYSLASAAEIDEGIARLSALVKAKLARAGR